MRPCESAHHHPRQRKERQDAQEMRYFMALCSFRVWRCMEMLRKAREFAKTSRCGHDGVHKIGIVGGEDVHLDVVCEHFWHRRRCRLLRQHHSDAARMLRAPAATRPAPGGSLRRRTTSSSRRCRCGSDRPRTAAPARASTFALSSLFSTRACACGCASPSRCLSSCASRRMRRNSSTPAK